MTWQELSRIALLGTERSHLSETTKEKLAYHGIHMDTEETQIVLESAAFFSQLNKAAFPLKVYEKELPYPADDEDESIINPKSTYHLNLILNGEYERALPEFIEHLEKNNRQLSPKNLPDLLNRCLESREFWQKIKPAIGKRGWWLLLQNPRWESLDNMPSPDKWASGTQEERLSFLLFFREKAPEKALEILEETWEKESLQEKIAFLTILKIGLSSTDEAFLEDRLYDSRKEIRERAATMLAQIPNSELSERMFIRAIDLISIVDENLEIELPEDPDETAIRDGISLSKKRFKGQKTGILHQIIAKINPIKWEKHFEKTPEQLLKLFYNSEWSKTLIQAVIEATFIHDNQRWAKPLLEMWLHLGNSDLWQETRIIALGELVDEKVFNQIAIQHLEKNKSFWNEKSIILKLLANTTLVWNEDLSLLIISRFQKWLITAPANFWQQHHYKKLLQDAAYKCPVSLYERLKKGWGQDSSAWGMWEKEVESFLRALVFRKEMIKSLQI